jgi:hypothetical protein
MKVDPVRKNHSVYEAFLLQNRARKGRSANYFAILGLRYLAGSTRTSFSGFCISYCKNKHN